MSEDAILRKIRALLALAGNNPNEAEAAAAAAKAQELMVAHNLDMSRTDEDKSRGYHRFAGGLYKWQRTLWHEIAELHFCVYWNERGMKKGGKYEHKLLGRTRNVASAQVLAEYLEGAIQRLTRDEYGTDPRKYFSSAANAYREGLADTLAYRLRVKRLAMKHAEAEARRNAPSGDTTNALVLTIGGLEEEERWANEDVLHGRPAGTTKANALKTKAQYEGWLVKYREAKKLEDEADAMLKQQDPIGWELERKRKLREAEEANSKAGAEEARKAKRRKGTGRAPKEKPAAYWAGRSDAERIGMDDQISKTDRAALGGPA